MAVLTQNRFLSNARISRIVGAMAAELEIKRPLNFLERTPLVNAFDDELFGRFTGKVISADIVADDQAATVDSAQSLETFTHALPNIKKGTRLGQEMLNRMKLFEATGYGGTTAANRMEDWERGMAENLILGVRTAMNLMACSMMIDDFDYNRFGIVIANGSWGMPAALKATASPAWSTAGSATPLSDIFAIDQYASLNYGVTYDTVTMSTAAFRAMIATTEFANKATFVLGANFLVTSTALLTKNDPAMLDIGQRVMGKTIVLDDTTYTTRSNAGSPTTTRVLPIGTALLSRSEDHGSGQAYDFANAVVTESVVADLIGGAPEGIGGDQYGPIAYYTGPQDLNPPSVTLWGVARGFPRKFLEASTATIATGVTS